MDQGILMFVVVILIQICSLYVSLLSKTWLFQVQTRLLERDYFFYNASVNSGKISILQRLNQLCQQDFEEFLLRQVRALSANERDGTFLIRDSISSAGSKVC